MYYIAFLRGINVGGNTMVQMAALRKAFEQLQAKHVRTLLNSGNVIFETKEEDLPTLTEKIEKKLERTFDFPIRVVLRTKEQIQELVHENPFKDINITSETRLYVTFLSDKLPPALKIHDFEGNDFKVLRVTSHEVCCVVMISPQKNTTDMMKVLEKVFGKTITTRNWNTVQKIAAL